MDRKRALTSETLTRVFSELDDDDDGELGPRVFCSALQVNHAAPLLWDAGMCLLPEHCLNLRQSSASICGSNSWP